MEQENSTSQANSWRSFFTCCQIPLYLFLFYVLLLTPLMGRKKGYTVDATPSFQITQAIVEDGDCFPEVSVKQGYLYSLVYLPFYTLGQVLSTFFSVEGDWLARKSMCWMNTLITALTVALLSLVLRQMRFSSRAQVLLPLFYGVSTLAFAYARYDYNKCLAGFFFLLAYYNLLRSQNAYRIGTLLATGISLALLAMVRLEMSVVLPLFLFYGLWYSPNHREGFRRLLVLFVPWLLGALFVVVYNWMYWQGEVAGGYEGGFHFNPFPAITGFLFSPGKNIWLFNPILLLLPLSLRSFYTRSPSQGWLWGATSLTLFLLYSFWGNWWGGWGWGPRHLVPLIPILVLPLAAWIDEKGRTGYLTLILLGLLGFIIQMIGSAIDFNDVIMVLMKNGVSEQALIWDSRWNPLLQHFLFLSNRPLGYWDIGWIGLYQSQSPPLVLFLLLLWLMALSFLIWRLIKITFIEI